MARQDSLLSKLNAYAVNLDLQIYTARSIVRHAGPQDNMSTVLRNKCVSWRRSVWDMMEVIDQLQDCTEKESNDQ